MAIDCVVASRSISTSKFGKEMRFLQNVVYISCQAAGAVLPPPGHAIQATKDTRPSSLCIVRYHPYCVMLGDPRYSAPKTRIQSLANIHMHLSVISSLIEVLISVNQSECRMQSFPWRWIWTKNPRRPIEFLRRVKYRGLASQA
jgi:hypothetical protein